VKIAFRLYRTRKYFLFALLVITTVAGTGQSSPQTIVIAVPDGKIDAMLPDEPLAVSSKDLLDWIKAAANAVSLYYGRFPVRHLTLRVRSDSSSGVHGGVTYPRNGGLILVTVGKNATVADLKDDWVLTHEMIHLAFPSMEDAHHWIEEGISTYVEPVARVRAGQMPADEMWRQFIIDMPKGQPQSGDRGLDNTHTWANTYWGGAMFCLLADVQIRERTHNRKGLQDALRGVLAHGDINEDWEIEKALDLGDRATGTTILRDLYKKMRDPHPPADLDQLWQKLGLELKDRHVIFNDKAPEAAIRRAITAPGTAGDPAVNH
jgi:hypothetical protein